MKRFLQYLREQQNWFEDQQRTFAENTQKLQDRVRGVLGFHYAPDAGIHFVAHYGKHPKHGLLYIGKNNRITNNPQEAKPMRIEDAAAMMGRQVPILQPKFKINGEMITRDHPIHEHLKGTINNATIDIEPRTIDPEYSQKKSDEFHARSAIDKIMEPEPLRLKELSPEQKERRRRIMGSEEENS